MNKQQRFELGDYLIDLVKNIFPNNAEFKSYCNSDNYICKIDWKLKNDKNCLNKRFETIILNISTEALDDYIDNPNKQHAQNRFINEIASRYKNFNPNNNEWEIKTSDIN